MNRYGNIDGIATLTNNPNATDNAKGTIGKKNGCWNGANQFDEVCDAEITVSDVIEFVGKLFTKE